MSAASICATRMLQPHMQWSTHQMTRGAFHMKEKHRGSFASGCILTRWRHNSHASGAIATHEIADICDVYRKDFGHRDKSHHGPAMSRQRGKAWRQFQRDSHPTTIQRCNEKRRIARGHAPFSVTLSPQVRREFNERGLWKLPSPRACAPLPRHPRPPASRHRSPPLQHHSPTSLRRPILRAL